MKKNLYSVACALFLFLPSLVNGQAIYETTMSGNWTDPAIWQIQDGAGGHIPATTYPTGSDGAIGIMPGHLVTINENIPDLNEVFVLEGSSLTIAKDIRVTLTNVDGDELTVSQALDGTVDGKVTIFGTLQANSGSTIAFDKVTMIEVGGTGTYQHNNTTSAGTIPLMTWSEGSTLLISEVHNPTFGSSASAPTNLDQNFSNVVWNLASFSKTMNLNGSLKSIRGKLEFISTGTTGSISLFSNTSTTTNITIGGDFLIKGSSAVNIAHSQSTAATINVGGNLELSSSRPINFVQNAILAINVGGNFIVNGTGVIDMVRPVDATGNVTVAVNLTTNLINGTIQKSAGATGLAEFIFNTVEIPLQADASITNSIVRISGNWTNSGGTFNSAMTASTMSNFYFQGIDQSIQSANQPFGHVTMANGGIKSVADALNIDGNLSIIENSTLTLSTPQASVTLSGDWVNTSGTFVHNNGSVLLDGGVQNITSLGQAFGTLTIDGTNTKFLQDGPLNVDGNLTINSSLDVNGNNGIFLAGDWINNGTLIPGSGTISFDGSSMQTIGGSNPTSFNNLQVLNVSSIPAVRVATSQNIFGNLTLVEQARFAIDTAADFTLKSTPTTTANIGPLINGAEVIGAVIVERFVMGHGVVFRYVATPVKEAQVEQLTDDMQVYLAGGTGADVANIYFYDESKQVPQPERWTEFAQTLSDIFQVGRGYALETTEGTTDITIDIKGEVNQGSFSFPVTYTNIGVDAEAGWNLLGNPYPSAINWISTWSIGGTNTVRSDIDPVAWIPVDRGGELKYASFNAKEGVGLNGGSPVIASGQGFWIKALNVSASLSIEEGYKEQTTTTEFFRKQDPEDVLVVGISNGSVLDETALIFRSDAIVGFEKGRDILKLKNTAFSLSSLGENQEDLAYNILPWQSCSKQIPLYLDNAEAGSYSFSFRHLETFTRDVSFTLTDAYAEKEIAVSATSTYNFTVSDDPKSFGKERFIIQASYAPVQLDLPLSVQASCVNQQASVFIDNAQKDVQYQAYVAGDAMGEATLGAGDILEISFSTTGLSAGEHIMTIKAQRYECDIQTLTTTATFHLENTYPVTQTVGGATCGEGIVTLTAAGAPADGKYRWYASADATEVLAETTETEFTTPSISKSTSYFVAIVSAKGCEGSRMKVTAEVSQVSTPEISLADGKLTTSGTGTYQWFIDGVPIEGATSASIQAVQTGSYTVKLTSGACEAVSKEYLYEVTGLEELSSLGLAIWPTPAQDNLYIKQLKQSAAALNIRIISLEGKQLLRQRTNSGAGYVHSLNIQDLKSGMYLLELEQEGKVVRVRIVKH